MSIAHAEKEIRALARKLGVKPWLIRDAIKSMTEGNGADGAGMPAAASAGSTGEDHESNEKAHAQARSLPARQEGRQARLLTKSDLAPRAPVKKDKPVEDKAYRRLVAQFPCINCGMRGFSQAAHENTGKGKGMKTDDRRTFALCTVAANGCHEAFDQYRLFNGRAEHAAMGAMWSKNTREAIRSKGWWPKDLEYLED